MLSRSVLGWAPSQSTSLHGLGLHFARRLRSPLFRLDRRFEPPSGGTSTRKQSHHSSSRRRNQTRREPPLGHDCGGSNPRDEFETKESANCDFSPAVRPRSSGEQPRKPSGLVLGSSPSRPISPWFKLGSPMLFSTPVVVLLQLHPPEPPYALGNAGRSTAILEKFTKIAIRVNDI